jgi:hypothetical protein
LIFAGFAIGAAKMLEGSFQRPDYQGEATYVGRMGGSADPVIEAPDLSPAPTTGFEAALGDLPRGSAPKHVLRVGLLRPATIARRATRLARGGRPLFIVTPGVASFAALRRSKLTPLFGILKALPPDFRAVHTKTFPGLAGAYPLSVYVLRAAPS